MSDFRLEQGDEVVLLRRRKSTHQEVDDKTGTAHDVTSVIDTEFGSVRCPDNLTVATGTINTEFTEDQRYLVVRLKVQ